MPLASHRHQGHEYPLLWAREVGRSRVVAHTLGRGVESYESAGHRRLLSRAIQWLTGSAS